MARKTSVDPADAIIGREIRRLRLQYGLSQEDLARRFGRTPAIIGDMENGLRSPHRYLYRLAVFFRVKVTDFTSLVEPCPHCNGSGVRERESRSASLRQALVKERRDTL